MSQKNDHKTAVDSTKTETDHTGSSNKHEGSGAKSTRGPISILLLLLILVAAIFFYYTTINSSSTTQFQQPHIEDPAKEPYEKGPEPPLMTHYPRSTSESEQSQIKFEHKDNIKSFGSKEEKLSNDQQGGNMHHQIENSAPENIQEAEDLKTNMSNLQVENTQPRRETSDDNISQVKQLSIKLSKYRSLLIASENLQRRLENEQDYSQMLNTLLAHNFSVKYRGLFSKLEQYNKEVIEKKNNPYIDADVNLSYLSSYIKVKKKNNNFLHLTALKSQLIEEYKSFDEYINSAEFQDQFFNHELN